MSDNKMVKAKNIFKRYDLIYSQPSKNIGENELKLLNILHIAVNDLVGNCNQKYSKLPEGDKKIRVNVSDIANLMGLKGNNENKARLIKRALDNMANAKIDLKNFMHPYTGKIYSWYSSRLVLKHKKEKYGREIDITLDELIVQTMWRRIKYAPISLLSVSKFKSKYTIRLYEAIIFQTNIRKDRTEINFNLQALNEIFMKPDNKYISKISDLINTCKVVDDIRQCAEFANFNYKVFKKDKKITVYL